MGTLREWRLRRVLSIRELAKAARISPTTVARVELGAPVRFATIRKLAAALDVAPADVAEFRAALGLPAADSDAA